MDREKVLRKIQDVRQKRLIELDLSNHWKARDEKKLTKIPAEVFELKWLKVLKLNYNRLTNLSEREFDKMKPVLHAIAKK